MRAVVHGVRTAAAAGCRTIVLTNGCGGLNPAWAPGTPVLIRDHINLTAHSPHRGRELRRPHRPLLAAAARPRPRGRPRPRRGRLRAVPRAALRDAGRGADGQGHRRRPRRHVDDARGDRRPPGRPGGARHLAGDQPRRRHQRPAASATPRCSRPGQAAAERCGRLLADVVVGTSADRPLVEHHRRRCHGRARQRLARRRPGPDDPRRARRRPRPRPRRATRPPSADLADRVRRACSSSAPPGCAAPSAPARTG